MGRLDMSPVSIVSIAHPPRTCALPVMMMTTTTDGWIDQCLGLLSKLKALCEQKTQIFNDRMDKCREILTPRQVIKLLLWIDEHSQVLEKVCPGWGSEQIPTKNPKRGS